MLIKRLQTQYIVRISILGALLLTIYSACHFMSWPVVSNAFIFILLLFTAVSTVCHFFLLKTAARSFQKFTNAFLLTTTIKLLMYLSLMAAYAFLNKTEAKLFILNFAVIYFIYTPFEVFMILKQAKTIDKNNEKQ